MSKKSAMNVFDTIGQKRYKTRLNDVQKDAIESALSELEKITGKEKRLKAIFNKKMVQARDELCAEMNKLSVKKSVIQNHAADVVTMTAVKLVTPLNARKVQRIVDKQKKAVARPQQQKNRVRYNQKMLTDALVYLVKQFFQNGKKYSIRKAAALYMDNKYASLTRVWNANQMRKICDNYPECDAVLYAARVQIPQVIHATSTRTFAYIHTFIVCLLLTCTYTLLLCVVCCADGESFVGLTREPISRTSYGVFD